MKILSDKKYNELTSLISTLERTAGEVDAKRWSAGYDAGRIAGIVQNQGNTRQQFIEKLRAAYLEAPNDQVTKLLLAYDAPTAPTNRFHYSAAVASGKYTASELIGMREDMRAWT